MNIDKKIKETLENNGITRLFAYSRKSRDIDNEGLKKHHKIIQELADELGMPITFYQEVESSETLNRPMLNLLREDIKKKKVRCLVVYRIDRLSRKVTDTERLVKEISFNGLILIEAHREKIVNYNEILGIKLEAMMSDLYQEQAKLVLTAGRKKSVQLYGNHQGETPLGYDYDRNTKKLVPNQDALTVQEIFNLYLKGHAVTRIAVMMNQRGFTTKRGGFFRGKAIWSILQNDKYVGVQTYGKQEWYRDVDRKVQCKDRPKEQWIVYKDAHEPIIDKETFEKVQKLIANNSVASGKDRKYLHALTGLVVCGKCGGSMTLVKRTYVTKEATNVRSCYKMDFVTGQRCSNGGILGEVVEDYIVKAVFNTVRPLVLRMTKSMAKDKKIVRKQFEGHELDKLFKQEKQLKQQMDKLIEMQLEFHTDRVAIKMKQVEAQLAIIQDRIESLSGEATVDELTWVDVFLKEAEDLVGFPFSYRGMNEEDKNIFLKKYVKHATLSDGEITGIKYTEEVEKLFSLRDNCNRQAEESVI